MELLQRFTTGVSRKKCTKVWDWHETPESLDDKGTPPTGAQKVAEMASGEIIEITWGVERIVRIGVRNSKEDSKHENKTGKRFGSRWRIHSALVMTHSTD
jgi:hypothetical protein